VPNDWSQLYIENLKPGDSIQVGSRLYLNWSVRNAGEFVIADTLKFITPKNTYEMSYFKTAPYSMSLENLLEGVTESDDVRVWLSIITRTDEKGGHETYFDCVDNLRFVSPPSFKTNVVVAIKKVNLTWEPYPKTDYYVIKKKGYGEKFFRLKTLRGVTTFLDDEVSPDSDYWYQVEARNAKDEVIARSDIKVKTPFVVISPKTSVGKRYVTLTWDRVSWIEGFNVLRKDGEKWQKLNADLLSSSDFLDSDLISGKQYCYKVEGVTNEGRIVAGSEEVCAETEFEEIEAKIVADTQTAEISWSSTTGVDSYGIKRLTSNGLEMIVSGILGNRYTDKNLDQDKEYVYQVVGFDKDGNQIAKSQQISVNTQKIAIIEIQAETHANSIKLKWQPINKISKLELWKDGKFLKVISSSLDAYLDFGLLPKTRYCYNLKAFNINGNLVASGQACFETTAKITTVIFTVGSKEWTVDGLSQPPMSVAPEMTGGSLFLVTRYLVQTVGAGVSWDAKSKTVGVMRKDGYWFNLQVGNPVAVVNGSEVMIGGSTKKIAPFIKNGFTFCPFRFLANNLGASNDDIVWDASTKTVKIIFR
jgi:fibronectin type 3 domain-containing protein